MQLSGKWLREPQYVQGRRTRDIGLEVAGGVDAEAVVAECGLGIAGEVRVKHSSQRSFAFWSHRRHLSAAANERKRESYLSQA